MCSSSEFVKLSVGQKHGGVKHTVWESSSPAWGHTLSRLPVVLQEFFQLLMRDMFDANYGMFKLDEETRMYWFRPSNIDMTMEFELVGTMIGLAIYNSHLLEFSFPMLTYRLVNSRNCLHTPAWSPRFCCSRVSDPSRCQQTPCARSTHHPVLDVKIHKLEASVDASNDTI